MDGMTQLRHLPIMPHTEASPGWILAKHIVDRGFTFDDITRLTGCPVHHIERVVTGKDAMDERLATRLRDVFGERSPAWIEIDAAFRLDSVLRGEQA